MPDFFNEMYVEGTSSVREHYREFSTWLAEQAEDIIARKRAEADLIFRRVGITFAVYGNDAGTERLIPFDIISRIIPAVEWTHLKAGLTQRRLFARQSARCMSATPNRWSSSASTSTSA